MDAAMKDGALAATGEPAKGEGLRSLGWGAAVRCPRCGARLLSEESPRCARCGVDPRSEAARERVVRTGSRAHELLRGSSYVFRGLARIVADRRIFALAIFPLLLDAAFVAGITWFVLPPVREWLRYATSPDMFTDWLGWWRFPRYALELLGWLVRVAPFVVMPALLAWILATPPFRIVFAALGTRLSEGTEKALLHESAPGDLLALDRSTASAAFSALSLSVLEVAVYCVLLPLALVPVLGTFAWLIVPRAVFAGVDAADPTLCRKSYAPGEKTALVSLRRWRFLGFGATVFFLTGFPVLNAFIFPVAAVGGTLLYLELDRK